MTTSPVAGIQTRTKALIASTVESIKARQTEAKELISSEFHVPASTLQVIIDSQELLRVWGNVEALYVRYRTDEQRLYAALQEWMDNAQDRLVDGGVNISSSLVGTAINMAEEAALRTVVKQVRLKLLRA